MLRTYTDQAIVLRTTKLGEADMILTLLTLEHGQVRAVAKGLRRTSSKFGARLTPFNRVKLQLHSGRNLDTITQAESLSLHAPRISSDYERYLSGQVMLETAEKLSEGEASRSQYRLLAGAIPALANRAHRPGMVLSSYLLRTLAIAGWAPALGECALCGADGPFKVFSAPAGGVVCENCQLSGGLHISMPVIELLTALLAGQWPQVYQADPLTQGIAEEVVTAYTEWVLERKLKSLSVMARKA